MRGGAAEDQRSDQLHVSDGREEVHRADPLGPEGRGQTVKCFNLPHLHFHSNLFMQCIIGRG